MTTVERYVTPRQLPAELELPPGPRWPGPLQTLLWLTAGTYVAPRWHRRYGEVFCVRLAPAGPGVVLSSPEHIREVFAGGAETFHAGEGNALLGPIMGEHSVLLLDEDAHKAARRRVMSAFHGETIASWAPAMEEIAARDVAQWPTGTPFAVHPRLNDISLEIIVRIVFGVTDERRLAVLRPRLRQVVGVGPTIFLGFLYPKLTRYGPWRDFLQLKESVDDLLYAEIAQRRTVADLDDRRDVLSRLLVADPDLSDAELRDHLVTLLLAGHETTASTLAWTLHDLARDPRVLARVRRAVDDDDAAYLDATVKEAMRLRPVIRNVARRLNRPARVGGFDLPAGVVVFPSIYLVQHRPDVYPDPDRFRPERFIGANPPPATWIPFGGGLRRCLGAALATAEAHAVLKAVLRRVDLAPVGGPEPARTRNITSIPGRGARLVILPR
jgi:cytochrome P450